MGERHAYGTACFCVSRRLFLLTVFVILAIVNVLIVGDWFASSHAVSKFFTFSPQPVHGCSGLECYQVFTCSGLRQTTQHLREPIASLSGAVFFPLGALGAQSARSEPLRVVSLYLLALVALQGFLIIADCCFIRVCDEFPTNLVYQTLLWGPAAPMPHAAEAALRAMDRYPTGAVAAVTNGLRVESWYLLVTGLYWTLLAYTLVHARLLSLITERGPLGLGVHFGLDQWDEAINYEALALKRMRETNVHSKLAEDGQNTNAFEDIEAPFGYPVSAGSYGATGVGTLGAVCAAARMETRMRLSEVLASHCQVDEDIISEEPSDDYGGGVVGD